MKAILRSVNSPTGLALNASGNPKKSTKAYSIGFIVLIGSIYPLSTKFGVEGAALAILFSVVAASPILWYEAMKVLKINVLAFFKPVLMAIMNTSLMMAAIIYLKLHVITEVGKIDFIELIFL